MTKRLHNSRFISLRDERALYNCILNFLDICQEEVSRVQKDTIPIHELVRNRDLALNLLHQIEQDLESTDSSKYPTIQENIIILQNIYTKYLAPFKLNQETAKLVYTKIKEFSDVMALRATPQPLTKDEYDQAANTNASKILASPSGNAIGITYEGRNK